MAEARFDERWDRLSAGTLASGEEAELRALAETSAEAREAWEAFRPFDSDFRARMVRQLGRAAEAAGTEPTDAAGTEPTDAARSETPAGQVLRFDRWRIPGRRGFLLTAGALAAAALVVLTIRDPGGEMPPLPGYGLSLEGGVLELRSELPAGEGERVFEPGSRFELVLRPATAVTGPVAVRFFLVGGGEPRPVELPAEIDPGGAVRVRGEIGRELAVGPGEWMLWAVVGRVDVLDDDQELSASLGAPPTRDRVALRAALRISVPPS